MIDRLTSRKFMFAILSVLLVFALTITGQITSKEFVDFLMVIGGIYVVGNVGETLVRK